MRTYKSALIISVVLFISFFLCKPLFCQTDYAGFPLYQNVLVKFFEKYSVQDIPKTSQLRFEKKPDGWHITVNDYSTGQSVTTKDEMFWSKKSNKFSDVKFNEAANSTENSELLDAYLNDWNFANYKISPYFGYPGWDLDVINDYKDSKNLSDTALYARGRAYSSYASNLLNNNSGFGDSKQMFVLPEGKNTMTSEQLAKYRQYRHLGIEKFEELAKRNPDFETIVGTIGLKASNEHMTSFLDIRTYQNEEEAKKELPDNLYNEFVTGLAKNYLMSCPQNAILFTNGDNDTYPLLYVQAKLGYRTDVLVVNLSLLQTDRYINSLREPVLNAKGLPVTFTPEQIKGTNRDVIIVNNEKNILMELSDMIKFLKDDRNMMPYGATSYFYVPAKDYSFISENDSLHFRINQQYFFRSQMIFYDLLNTIKWERPFCFAITVGDDYFFGLTDYMQLNGMAYQLCPGKKQNSVYGLGSVNTDIMYTNLTGNFDMSGIDKVSRYEKLPCMNYRNIYYRLAEALINENKTDSAKTVLDKGVELFPDNILYFDVYMIPFVDYYYRLNEFEKGNNIAKVIVINLKNNKDNYNNISNYSGKSDNETALKMLKDLAEKYNQAEILKVLE